MVTQGRAGQARPVGESAAEMEDPVKVSSKGRPDSFASWLLSVPTPVPAAGTWFQITYSKTFTPCIQSYPKSRVGRPRLSDGLPSPPQRHAVACLHFTQIVLALPNAKDLKR